MDRPDIQKWVPKPSVCVADRREKGEFNMDAKLVWQDGAEHVPKRWWWTRVWETIRGCSLCYAWD